MCFQDKVVLVTGAATGIGYGICRAFVKEDTPILLNNVDGTRASYGPYLS